MKYRTVFCEDNIHVHELIVYILEERGHEVFSYKDPSECPLCSLDKCTQTNPCSDIIISDISMPNINGLEFIEHLQLKGCKIKNIALVSGYWTKKNIEKGKEMGCFIFHKPIQPEELFEWISICEKNIDPERVLSDFP